MRLGLQRDAAGDGASIPVRFEAIDCTDGDIEAGHPARQEVLPRPSPALAKGLHIVATGSPGIRRRLANNGASLSWYLEDFIPVKAALHPVGIVLLLSGTEIAHGDVLVRVAHRVAARHIS